MIEEGGQQAGHFFPAAILNWGHNNVTFLNCLYTFCIWVFFTCKKDCLITAAHISTVNIGGRDPSGLVHNLCLYVCILPLFLRGNGSRCKIVSVNSLELLDGNGGLPGKIKTV